MVLGQNEALALPAPIFLYYLNCGFNNLDDGPSESMTGFQNVIEFPVKLCAFGFSVFAHRATRYISDMPKYTSIIIFISSFAAFPQSARLFSACSPFPAPAGSAGGYCD